MAEKSSTGRPGTPSSTGTRTEASSAGVGSEAQRTKEKVKDTAREAGRQATSAARERAETSKADVGARMHETADAVERAADELAESGQETLAQTATALAGRLDDLAVWLEDRSVDQMLNDLGGFARRNPFLFIAGSVALGIGLSRFFKASSRSHRGEYATEGYGAEDEWDESFGPEYEEFGDPLAGPREAAEASRGQAPYAAQSVPHDVSGAPLTTGASPQSDPLNVPQSGNVPGEREPGAPIRTGSQPGETSTTNPNRRKGNET